MQHTGYDDQHWIEEVGEPSLEGLSHSLVLMAKQEEMEVYSHTSSFPE